MTAGRIQRGGLRPPLCVVVGEGIQKGRGGVETPSPFLCPFGYFSGTGKVPLRSKKKKVNV